ncbi:MAG: apolipoprotein N-acyltransferase [Bacteroidales bacterium]|nr:apolipoprotein N-acyltransferase [Candidatus Cacconaster merdequi]
MKRIPKLNLWLAIIEFAALASLPFLAEGCGLISLVAFVPLLLLDKMLCENKVRGAWLYLYAAFLLFNVGTTFWIWFVSPAGAVAALLLNALQMTIIFLLFGVFRKIISRRWPDSPRVLPYLFLVVLWLAWEHIYFEIELSWPWLVLGNALATSTYAAQWYDVTGTLGGSLWILLCNISVFLAITAREKKASRRAAALSLALVVIPLCLSVIRYASYKETDSPCEVVVVQPNIDPFAKYGITPQVTLDEKLIALAEGQMTDNTEYVITPETFTYAVDIDSPAGNPSMERYAEFLDRHPSAELILGALTYRTYDSRLRPSRSARLQGGVWLDSFNTAMITDGREVSSYYFKSKLVPGVEIIPYGNVLTFLGPLVEKFGGSPNTYGTQDEMGVLHGKKQGPSVGAFICYESIYGDFSRMAAKKGAEILAVMTNDGWWGDTPGYHQHFRFAKLRAIENRRDLIHAANTGTSGIINQRGDVVLSTPWWEETSFRSEVNRNTAITPFVRCGDIIGTVAAWAALLSLLCMSLHFCVSGKRRASGKSA